MALSFPLPLADFWEKLPLSPKSEFSLGESINVNTSAGGAQFRATLGARLWQGKAVLGAVHLAEFQALEALIFQLQEPGKSFLAYPPRRKFATNDPLGAQSNLTIYSNSSNGNYALRGFSVPTFSVEAGDFIEYKTPNKTSTLHQVVLQRSAVSADIYKITVQPEFPSDTAWHAATLAKPSSKFIIRPGSYRPGNTVKGIVQGAEFSFIQDLG